MYEMILKKYPGSCWPPFFGPVDLLDAFGTLDQPPWSKIRGGGSRFDWNFPVKQPEGPLAGSP